jgi:hypothetical protein
MACDGECGGAAVEDSCGCCNADGTDEGWADASNAGNDCACGVDDTVNGWDGTATYACGPHYTYDCAGGCGTTSNSNSWTCGGTGNAFDCYDSSSVEVTVCNSATNGACEDIPCAAWGNDQTCKCDCGGVNTWDCLGTTCGGTASDDDCGVCEGSGESQACGCGPAGSLGTMNCLESSATNSMNSPGPSSYPIRGCVDNATGDYGAGAASGVAAGNYCWNAAYETGLIGETVYGETPVSPDSWQDVCYQRDRCGWCNGKAGTPDDQVVSYWSQEAGWKCNTDHDLNNIDPYYISNQLPDSNNLPLDHLVFQLYHYTNHIDHVDNIHLASYLDLQEFHHILSLQLVQFHKQHSNNSFLLLLH